ncbi:MAG: hypothetical protein ACRD3M_02280 [Thermoanaerobaculia bacterium]
MNAPGVLPAALAVWLVSAGAALSDEAPTGRFTATAEVSTPQGTRRMGFAIAVSRPLSRADALPYREALEKGGQQSLLALLRESDRGRFQLGAIEYPINLIVAEPVSDGYRYLVVTARNFRIEEVNEGRSSMDFPFAVAVFDVPEFGSGEGRIYPQAALSIDSDGRVQAQAFEDRTGTLKDVRRR